MNLAREKVRLPPPVFEGDILYAESEVLEVRPSRSRPNMGIVQVRTSRITPEGAVVVGFQRRVVVCRRGHAPSPQSPPAPAPER